MKRAMELIPPVALQLARKMVLVHHAEGSKDLPHWITSTNGHLADIHNNTFLKGHKRLSDRDMRESIWEEPLGEYSDYLRIHKNVSRDKSETELTPPSISDYSQIKQKYASILSHMSSPVDSPTYDSIISEKLK